MPGSASCSSPTYAAIFVIGKSENGLTRWKTVSGKTLKQLEAEESTEQIIFNRLYFVHAIMGRQVAMLIY